MTSVLRGFVDRVPGERALALEPPLAPEVDAGWGKRTFFFSGRSVGDRALSADQRHRAAGLATAGQRFAPGVVLGLEVGLEQSGSDLRLHIGPGLGLGTTGEDVRVGRALEVSALGLVVDDVQTLQAAVDAAPGAALAFVVQLQPILLERTGERDPSDPCERDPTELAFQDEQLVDGVRVALRSVDPALIPSLGPAFRNRLAHEIFRAEAARLPGDLFSWEPAGLPVALLAFPGAEPAFVDVDAVARRGGRLKERSPLLAGAGTPRLWQARLEQFLGELREADLTALRAGGLSSRFRFLPPVGLLPKDAVEVRGDFGEPDWPLPTPAIFPGGFTAEAAPIELEALDEILESASFQEPLDLEAQEQVQILVPIPQAHFDPSLLIVEDETPDEFRIAIQFFLLRLNHRLGRRYWVRWHDQKLAARVSGETRTYPEDPGVLVGELGRAFPSDRDLPPSEVPPPEPLYAHTLDVELRALVETMDAAVGSNNPPSGPVSNPRPLAVLLQAIGRPRGISLTPTLPLSDLQDRFLTSNFGGGGLAGFVDDLARRLVGAAERLDLSFERVQAELYRIRSYVSGEEAATQLATSPVVTAVAARSLQRATAAQLSLFTRNVLLARVARRPSPPAGTVITSVGGIPTGGRDVASAVLFGRSVRQRVESSVAVDALGSARRGKINTFRALTAVHGEGLSLDGLRFAGFVGFPPEAGATIGDVEEALRVFDAGGGWPHDPDPTETEDEAVFFTAAVQSLEEVIASLRQVEARLTAYESGLTVAREALELILDTWDRVRARLLELEDEIEELRQDIRTARLLEAEERERARAVNEARRRAIEEHVPFLVFRRPRTLDGDLAPPGYPTAPAQPSAAVPACLEEEGEAPEPLRAMADLLREAPLRWLAVGPGLARRLDRWAALRQLLEAAAHRARSPEPFLDSPFGGPAFADRRGQRLHAAFSAQALALEARRQRASSRFLEIAYPRLNWNGLLPLAEELATVNDLLLARHGRADVARLAAEELSSLARVAGCLFERFRRVPPFLRLQWAEGFGERDEPADFRDLGILPDWGEVDRRERRDLQALVDWLYSRVLGPDATQFVSELVRVALLLASHAPMNGILEAAVIERQPVGAGARLSLRLAPERARVGMYVLLYESGRAGEPAARGVVDDLGNGVVSVQIVATQGRRAVVPLRAEVLEPERAPRLAATRGLVSWRP